MGDQLHGYAVTSVEDVPELCLTAYKLRHTRTGAEHLHIAREDSNNVFSVSFRTTPSNSTGVAHILEHLALCGSAKYPVRDPFMKMLTRSLSTFMNAFTGPDYTMYPFSTQNSRDFYNLLSIYLDATFHPRLRQLDFLQEGWRLEHADINDRNSPLVFKGVVFNEMKGVFSSPSAIYTRALINKLFPDNTYANESGGDPLVIPSLSYEELKDFHAQHYHPSNSRFFTYGNFPLEQHLEAIDKVIGNFEENSKLAEGSFVNEQTRWKSAVHDKLSCQNDPLAPFPDKQTTLGVTYMLESLTDTHENFTLAILGSLLTDGPSSPFYEALIDSGLGSDYAPFSGVQKFTKQSLFSIGLQGIAPDQSGAVQKAINMALKNAYTEGFPMERVDAILHRIELGTKHQSSNFGLGLAMNLNTYWNHGVDPIQCLRVNEHVEQFKRSLAADPKYLQKKVREHFIDNSHKLVIEMSPSDSYESKLAEAEKTLLEKKIAKLTDGDRAVIYENGKQLLAAQEATEDLSILPTLNVHRDISRSFKATAIEKDKVGGVPVQWSAQPTNGIVYFNAVTSLQTETFPMKLIPFLPLFSSVMTKLGAGPWDRKKLDQEVSMRTDGLGVGVHIADHHTVFGSFEQGLTFSSHCLERNVEAMFALWTELFRRIRFDDDHEHLKQLIRIASAELAASVPHNGHRYAMTRAASSFGGAMKMRELVSGMSSLAYFRLVAASPEKVQEVVANLKQIAELLLNGKRLRIAINGEAAAIRSSLATVESFVSNIGGSGEKAKVGEAESTTSAIVMPTLNASTSNEHFIFPFSTNYLSRGVFCAPFSHPDFARLRIASSLVSAKFLHREIREKGGAYGGGAKFDSSGVFSYFSYRDPQVTGTMEAFDRAGEWLLRTDNYTDAEIDEAKLQVFQSVDAPVVPGEAGLEQFLIGRTDEMRQEYRLRLLEVGKADIQEVAERYLIGSPALQSGVCLIGPSSEVTANNDKWKVRIVSQ